MRRGSPSRGVEGADPVSEAASQRPVILVVEDEPVLRGANARALRGLGDVEVFEAANVREALAVVDASRPDVVVSDIDLPDRSGIELIGEFASRGLSVPVLFVTAYYKAYKAQIPRHGQVEVLEKPLPTGELRTHVRRLLGNPKRVGPASPFGVSDYLQIACLGRHNVRIEVNSDDASGEVVVVQGEAWRAENGLQTGFPAFMALCFAEGAMVTCQAYRGDPGPRNLEWSWEMLLLEAARVHDEEAANRPAPTVPSASALDLGPIDEPPPSSPPVIEEAVPRPRASVTPLPNFASLVERAGADDELAAAFEATWDEAIGALLSKDYAAALRLLLRARELKPGDAKVAANLKRLADLGFSPGPVE